MIEQSGTRTTPRLDLGAAVMEFMEQGAGLIGTRVLPIFPAARRDGIFNAITRECLTRDLHTKRAMRGKYNREGIETAEVTYKCEEHGLEGALDDGERSLYANDFDAEMVTVQGITGLLLLAQEKRIASAVFNTSVFTGSSLYSDNSSTPWGTAATDIIGQILAAKEKVRQLTGMKPNAIIMSETNKNRCLQNTGIKAAIQYVARLTEAEIMNALADLFGVKYVLVGGAIRNTANKGKTFSGADVWSPLYAMLAVIAEDSQNLAQPCIGRSMLWTEDSPENALVEQYRDEEIKSNIYRVRHSVDELIIDPSFAHLLKVSTT